MASRTQHANDRFRAQHAANQSDIPPAPGGQFLLIDRKGERIHLAAEDLRKRVIYGKASPSAPVFDYDRGEWTRIAEASMPREVIIREVHMSTTSVGRIVIQVLVTLLPVLFLLGIIFGAFYAAITS
jgi:hypothetical protein